jgi:hypothetical protein
LDNNLVEEGNAEEDCDGVETMVDDVKDSVGNVTAAAKVTEGETEDEGQGVQGSSKKSVAGCAA